MDFEESGNGGDGDKIEVTLNVQLPDQGISSRAEYPLNSTISLGKKIDMLVFCIYEKVENEKQDHDEEIEIVSDEESGEKYVKIDEQHTMDVSAQSWPYSIKLSLDSQKKYKVALWAQSSKCTAYDTSDLTNIKVSYNEEFDQMGVDDEGNNVISVIKPLNNDEHRDAFWGVTDILIPGNNKVVLHRVMAQINLGTTGADYKTLIYDEKLNPANVTLTESQIKIKGVANRFNAFKGMAAAVDEYGNPKDDLVAEFDWATIPAWINTVVPEFKAEYLEGKPEDNPFVQLPDKEEFLKVKLNKDDEIGWEYLTEYPTVSYKKKIVDGKEVDDLSQIDKYLAQTFKYLSMCYVLVPSKQDKDGNSTSATVELAYNMRQNIDGLRDIQLTERTIKNVPVQANFRTNILAGLYIEDPDPTSIFTSYQLPLILQDSFFEYTDVPEPDNNWKYYTATFNVTRTDPDNDDLIITNLGTGLSLNTKDKDEKEVTYLSQSVVFSTAVDNPTQLNFNQYEFKVREGYQISILCDGVYPQKPGTVGNEELTADYYNWWTTSKNENTEVLLYLFPGATAASFKITVDLNDKSKNGSGTPENPDDNP